MSANSQSCTGAPSTESFIEYLKEAVSAPENIEWMKETRRHIHKCPELAFEEFETSKYIKERLTELGIKFTEGLGIQVGTGRGGTGIIADLGTGESPCVALRADMDALPVHEVTEVDFKSRVDGKMHACGHDTHMTMLLCAAKALKARESEIQGTVRLIFQPAEEHGAGALMMAKEGILDIHPRVDRIFAIHQMPGLPRGIHGRAGGIMAGATAFKGIFHGKGGHAAIPHKAIDPLQPLANVIIASQSIVSRNLDPISTGVLSITQVTGSNTANVISETSSFAGTIRAYSQENMDLMVNRLKDMTETIGKTYGCPRTEFIPSTLPYIPTINTPSVWAEIKKDVGFVNQKFATDDSTPSELYETDALMTGEDFGFFLRERPGVFCFLGGGQDPEFSNPLHTPNFKFNEDILPDGALFMASTAITQLARLNQLKK